MGEITLSAAWAWLLAVFAAVITIDRIVDILRKYKKEANAPEVKMESDITSLRDEIADIQNHLRTHDAQLAADNLRLKEIEKCQRMQLRAIRSLLAHGLDGNNVDAMGRSAKEIDDYLYERN